jgi:hypothetical protein
MRLVEQLKEENMTRNYLLMAVAVTLLAFGIGRWAGSSGVVRADSGDAQIDVRQIDGSSSLVVYYPSLKKLFVYQPFAGPPTWNCAYSIQLSAPGGTVERKACGN